MSKLCFGGSLEKVGEFKVQEDSFLNTFHIQFCNLIDCLVIVIRATPRRMCAGQGQFNL